MGKSASVLGMLFAATLGLGLSSGAATAGQFLDDDGTVRGVYVQGEGGIAVVPNQNASSFVGAANTPVTIEHDNAISYGAQLGVALPESFRVEAEGIFHRAERNGFGPAGTDTEILLLMANVLYDMDVGNFPIRPYWGGGLGAALVNYNVSLLNGEPFDNETTNFAWQLTTGARTHVTKGLFLDVNYTYSRTRAPGVSSFITAAGGNVGLDIQRIGLHGVRGGLGFEF